MEQGACLGIPGITAHRAVHVAGDVSGRTVLVQGAAGSVGLCAVQLARQAGARVIGTVRSSSDERIAHNAGADEVLQTDKDLIARVRALAANVGADIELLKEGGSIATYATNVATPNIPFWEMVFKNAQLFFLGSDDFPTEAKVRATRDLNRAFESGWSGF